MQQVGDDGKQGRFLAAMPGGGGGEGPPDFAVRRALGPQTASLGVAGLPAFLARDALEDGRLEQILPDWCASQASLYLLTPPSGPRPVRVQVLADFLTGRLSRA